MDTSSTDEWSSAVTEPGSLAAFTAPTQAEFAMVVGDDPDDAPVDFFNRRFMNWMSFLSSSAKLTDLVIPGSHESASYSMRSWLPGPLPILEDNWSEFLAFASQTQSFNLPGQLLNGIRYLDLRVEQANNGEVIFCHGSSVKLDCQGNVVDPVIKNELTPFISAFPSEFLILDFQQICDYLGDPATTITSIQSSITAYLQPDTWAVPATKFSPQLTLEEIWSSGWRYMVMFSEKALGLAGNTPIEDWVVPRTPGNTGTPVTGNFWDPWSQSVWEDGDASAIPAAINTNSQAWHSVDSPPLYVAQAVKSPTGIQSALGESPLDFEATQAGAPGGSIFNNWVAQLGEPPLSPVNIVIRDACDWFPEMIANLIGRNRDLGNVVTDLAVQEKFMFLVNASTNAQVVPLVAGTATGNCFEMYASPPTLAGAPYYPYFNLEIDNTTLEGSAWTFETGTQGVGTPLPVMKFDKHGDEAWYDFKVPVPSGSIVSYIKLQNLWGSGGPGFFRIDNGWVLQGQLVIHVQGDALHGAGWQLTVETVSADLGMLCNTAGN